MDRNPLLVNNIESIRMLLCAGTSALHSLWARIIIVYPMREKKEQKLIKWKKISLNIWTAQCYFSWKMFIIFGTFSSIVRCTALRKQFILCNLTALFDKWLCSQLRRPNVIFRQLFRPGQPDWTFIMPFFEFFARTFFSYSAAAAATAASSIHFFSGQFHYLH